MALGTDLKKLHYISTADSMKLKCYMDKTLALEDLEYKAYYKGGTKMQTHQTNQTDQTVTEPNRPNLTTN